MMWQIFLNVMKLFCNNLNLVPGGGIYENMQVGDNYPFRDDFDSVIRCLGFKFDASIFGQSPAARPASTQQYVLE